MKPIKKKTAKKTNHPIVGKLLDLKYRINEAYRIGIPGGTSFSNKDDKDWVMNQISDIRNGVVLGKEELMKANKLWNDYKPSRLNNWEDSHSRRDDV